MTDPLDQAGSTPRTGDPRARADGDCELARAVAMCAADVGFLAGLEQILLQADRAAIERRFECRQCGECCRFEQFGHRLYVTAGELALMLHLAPDQAGAVVCGVPNGTEQPRETLRRGRQDPLSTPPNCAEDPAAAPTISRPAAGLCPHQDQARCLARAGRALGCRLFFCAPSAHGWFCDAYESFHQQIKLLHAAHGLPYVYAELTAALAELASVAG
jgi:Fe-S-cluster containining protein